MSGPFCMSELGGIMNNIRGKVFVLTGKMWTSRMWIEDAITKLGGFVEPRMTRNVDTLVQACGQWGRQTDKYLYAKSNNIKIIDDKELHDMIVQANEFEAQRAQGGNGGK